MICRPLRASPTFAHYSSFGDRLVNVIEEGFDVVLRIGDIDDSRLSMRKLDSYQHLLVASPSYLARHGTPLRPADLSHHICLRYRFPSSGKLLSWPLVEGDQPAFMDVPESSIANDIGALQVMTEAGVGIAVLPEFVVADGLATGRLIRLLDGYAQDRRDICLLWPSGRQVLPKVRAFIDFMVERLGDSAR